MKEKKKLENALKKIGWSLRDHGCGFYYLYDHEGNVHPWHIYGKQECRLEYNPEISFRMSCVFYLKDTVIKTSKDSRGVTAVVVQGKTDKNIFLQFYNFRN